MEIKKINYEGKEWVSLVQFVIENDLNYNSFYMKVKDMTKTKAYGKILLDYTEFVEFIQFYEITLLVKNNKEKNKGGENE